MNFVDVNPTSSSRMVLLRNIVHVVVVMGGSVGMIAAAYWFLFAVLLPQAR